MRSFCVHVNMKVNISAFHLNMCEVHIEYVDALWQPYGSRCFLHGPTAIS